MRRLALSLAAAGLLVAPAVAPAQQPRIVNGAEVAAGEYAWTVGLALGGRLDGAVFCGGALIAADVVVTAAHCVLGLAPDQVDVLAGTRDRNTSDPAFYYDVQQIALHPDAAVADEDPILRYDVALLKLARDADPATTDVIPVVPASANGDDFGSLDVSGWGRDESGASPTRMRKATIEHWADSDCQEAWTLPDAPQLFHPVDMLCGVGATNPPADSCAGDSGGPLARRWPGTSDPWTLVGTVSWGPEECGRADRPGVYARLAAPPIRDFVTTPGGAPPAQPYRTAGELAFGGSVLVGGEVTCGPGTLQWSVEPHSVARLIWRANEGAPGREALLSTSGSYRLQSTDVGRQLQCEIRAKRSDAGGFGQAYSARSPRIEAPPAPPAPPSPPPTETPPPPAPPALVAPAAPRDLVAPRVLSIRRTCTARRRCAFTIRTSDAAPSAGIARLRLTLTSTRRRRCARGRTCTRRATQTLSPRRSADGTTFVVRRDLPRGRHVLTATAVDAAGNAALTPLRSRFTLR